jgi:hypothetical protein
MSRPVTRSTSYAPALDGLLTQHRRTPEQAKEMREKKAAAEKHAREMENYLEAYKIAQAEVYAKYHARVDKYEKDMETYKEYLDHVKQWGDPTNKRKIRKEPKPPAKPRDGDIRVPSNPSKYSDEFLRGGRRRTRRGRKSRSTRRR